MPDLKKSSGFTLVEILVVISLIVILSSLILLVINPTQLFVDTRASTAKTSLVNIAKAAKMYAFENGAFPDDVYRNIPPELISYLSPGAWPGGPFPGSVFDWDNWINFSLSHV